MSGTVETHQNQTSRLFPDLSWTLGLRNSKMNNDSGTRIELRKTAYICPTRRPYKVQEIRSPLLNRRHILQPWIQPLPTVSGSRAGLRTFLALYRLRKSLLRRWAQRLHQVEGATTRVSPLEIASQALALASTSTRQVEGATRHISQSEIAPPALGSTSTHQVEGAATHILPSEIAPLASTSTSAQPVEGGSIHQAAQASPLGATGQRQTPSTRFCGETWTWFKNTLRVWMFGPRGDII